MIPRHAHRLRLGSPVAPFGDRPEDLPVLGESLATLQERAVGEVGLRFEDGAGPALLIGDHTWVTPELLRRFLAACPPSGGQLCLDGLFVEATGALQRLPDGRYPLAIAPSPEVPLASLAPVRVDLGVTPRALPIDHPVFRQAMERPIPVTDAMIHSVEHWSHLLRVNLLALLALAEGERRRFERAPWWRRLLTALGLVWRARSLSPWRLAGAIGPRGRGCVVHPTATVEASHLGDGVEVGPHAVVRASWLGDGVKVGEHAQVNLTVASQGSVLSRGVMANLCLLLPGAFVSPGFGFQACVFGRESFVAMGATCFDLSFGGDVKVAHRGERVSSGQRFLGVCVGHRARLGPHVLVGYGEEVPNDAFLVTDPGHIFRRIPPDLGATPVFVRDGAITPVRTGSGGSAAEEQQGQERDEPEGA